MNKSRSKSSKRQGKEVSKSIPEERPSGVLTRSQKNSKNQKSIESKAQEETRAQSKGRKESKGHVDPQKRNHSKKAVKPSSKAEWDEERSKRNSKQHIQVDMIDEKHPRAKSRREKSTNISKSNIPEIHQPIADTQENKLVENSEPRLTRFSSLSKQKSTKKGMDEETSKETLRERVSLLPSYSLQHTDLDNQNIKVAYLSSIDPSKLLVNFYNSQTREVHSRVYHLETKKYTKLNVPNVSECRSVQNLLIIIEDFQRIRVYKEGKFFKEFEEKVRFNKEAVNLIVDAEERYLYFLCKDIPCAMQVDLTHDLAKSKRGFNSEGLNSLCLAKGGLVTVSNKGVLERLKLATNMITDTRFLRETKSKNFNEVYQFQSSALEKLSEGLVVLKVYNGSLFDMDVHILDSEHLQTRHRLELSPKRVQVAEFMLWRTCLHMVRVEGGRLELLEVESQKGVEAVELEEAIEYRGKAINGVVYVIPRSAGKGDTGVGRGELREESENSHPPANSNCNLI